MQAGNVEGSLRLCRAMMLDGMRHPTVTTAAAVAQTSGSRSNAERDMTRWLKRLYGINLDVLEDSVTATLPGHLEPQEFSIFFLAPQLVLRALWQAGRAAWEESVRGW